MWLYLGLYMGIMEKNMATTIGFRHIEFMVYGFPNLGVGFRAQRFLQEYIGLY